MFISISFLFVFVLVKEHISFLSSILEFCCYFYKHRRSGPICIYTGILMLSFQTLEFWSYFYTRRFSDLLLQRGEILALFLYTLVFWSYPSKRWNSSPIFIPIGFLIFSFQTVEFWPYFCTHRFFDLLLPNSGILASFVKALELLSYTSKHWNCSPFFL